jgi:hypothetical protein
LLFLHTPGNMLCCFGWSWFLLVHLEVLNYQLAIYWL